jgi:hypothetical protein
VTYIFVLAGEHRHFQEFERRNRQPLVRFIYFDDTHKMRGVRELIVIRIGSYQMHPRYQELEDCIHHVQQLIKHRTG